MASRALRPLWHPKLRFHAVSNVDGTQLEDLKEELDPERTLFVVCSKTFTTQETMFNANLARQWVVDKLDAVAVQSHFVAASTNHAALDDFGIRSDYRFGFWDWVGGRYSMWSAVGLSLALVIGMDNFNRILSGGRRMDLHFRQAPMDENMPVLLAGLSNWYNNFYGAETHVILPYTNRLDRFPAYLQQLQMESSGKSVRMDGKPVRCETGQIIWGEAGNNAQHSFVQLLHQGTRLIPADFILTDESELATANCKAQALALVIGMENFQKILAGGRRMDLHFRQAPMDANMPVLLAMLGNWYNNFFGAETHVILPYTNRLDRFPAYLQQLQMESSGKSVRMDGKPVRCKTGQIIWGEAGNNAQHSFMQLLHQGTRLIPADFILTDESELATANCRAQALALMQGTGVGGREQAPSYKRKQLAREIMSPASWLPQKGRPTGPLSPASCRARRPTGRTSRYPRGRLRQIPCARRAR